MIAPVSVPHRMGSNLFKANVSSVLISMLLIGCSNSITIAGCVAASSNHEFLFVSTLRMMAAYEKGCILL